MSETLGDRLEKFIKSLGLTKTEFGAAFRATRQEVSNWCNGRGLAVNRLADMKMAYPSLNIHWLLIGDPHPMEVDDTDLLNIASDAQQAYQNPNDVKLAAIKLLKKLLDETTISK